MPERQIVVNGVSYNVEERGSGDKVLFFGHGLMYNWEIFEHQLNHFAAQGYRCIAPDWRGQGKTEGGGDADAYSMYQLGNDALALLEECNVTACDWVGVSMGAMIAMRLYERKPELFRSLIIIDSSAADAPDLLPGYTQMAETFRTHGPVPPLLEALDMVFYTPHFIQHNPDTIAKWHAYWQQADRDAMYKAVMPVIDRDDVSDKIHSITVPALIIVGEDDYSTPVDRSEDLHTRLPDSQLVKLPQASHMSIVEHPEKITQVIDTFLISLK